MEQEDYLIEWDVPREDGKPTEVEVAKTLRRIRRDAKTNVAVSYYMTGAMHRYLKKHLKNSYISCNIDADRSPKYGDHLVIIGATESAVKEYIHNMDKSQVGLI